MEEIINAIKKIDKNIDVTFEDENTFYLCREDWNSEAIFELNEKGIEATIEQVRHFLNYKYVKNLGFINENYAELSINISNRFFLETFKGAYYSDPDNSLNSIYYEIGEISDDFCELVKLYHDFESEPEDYLTTIKIYNIDSVTNKSYKSNEFEILILEIAKCIIFDLSSKYSISLCLMQISDSDDYEEDPMSGVKEKLECIKNQTLKCKYDKDLIEYYYRALQMDESEFKYLAFYQVMECIYDEVFLSENIQDVKQVINSSWFSSYEDDDITQIIKIIEQYDKSKNDREKLKLVLEKYFRGNVHDGAYLLANKEIINLLIDMHIIKSENEFLDIQRLATVIYDYRCKCTHSNRTFPFRASFNDSSEEQNNYINLVKKISERIIMSYRTNEFKKEISHE